MEKWGRRAKPDRPQVSGLSAATAVVSGVAAAATGGASAGVTAAMTSLATDRAIDETVHTLKGFGSAFKSVVGRKMRELRGRRWERATERQRVAEANRRAADEVARRIERETGKRPSAATVRRNARQDKMPRGVDAGRLDRQSRIDDAGGVKPFAEQAGVNERTARRWKENGTPMSSASVQVIATVDGTLTATSPSRARSEIYNNLKNKAVDVRIHPPAADEVRAAYAASDMDSLAELLSPAITDQFPWEGEADRTFVVTLIRSIQIFDV